jgi:2Fe-2S ferredoxin
MEAARAAGVAGIVGECGGACACGTCHVQLSSVSLAQLGPATPAEQNILEFEDTAGPFSRLSCQIRVADVPDGTIFAIPGGDA